MQIGYWGLELARRLVESQKIPVCIINVAVGGSRIDQHQRNRTDPEDVATIYGRLLWRVRQANLAPQLRGATATPTPQAGAVPRATAASLNDMRNTLSAMQRGWQQGRSQTQRDAED